MSIARGMLTIPTLVIAFVPLLFYQLTTIGNIFYFRQNNVVKDLPQPLSH